MKQIITIKNNEFGIDYSNDTVKHTTCHFHAFYELCFYESGNRTYAIDNEYFNVYSNCVTLIKPYIQHSTKGSSHAARTVIYFTENFLRKYFTESTIKEILLSYEEKVKYFDTNYMGVKRLVDGILKAHEHNNELLCVMYLAQLLLEVKNYKQQFKTQENYIDTVISNAINYIHSNFNSIKSLEEIAKKLHISVSYLSSLFKNAIGTPIKQYIINTRINYACKALISTDKSAIRISEDCGFSSPTHFNNTFKKHLKVTPKQYRKNNKPFSNY